MQRLAESESMLIDRPAISQVVKPDKARDGKKPKGQPVKKTEAKEQRLWFCAEFNGITGCTQVSPHTFTDVMGREHEAHHICSCCYRQWGQKDHTQISDVCPLRA